MVMKNPSLPADTQDCIHTQGSPQTTYSLVNIRLLLASVLTTLWMTSEIVYLPSWRPNSYFLSL